MEMVRNDRYRSQAESSTPKPNDANDKISSVTDEWRECNCSINFIADAQIFLFHLYSSLLFFSVVFNA